MSERHVGLAHQDSPQAYARVGGALYLVIIVIGLLGEAYVRGSLIVAGDATATAQGILESEWLWRLGVAGQVVLLICAVALTLVFYVLLRPVHKNFALLAVFFALVSLSIEGVSGLYLNETLLPLTNAEYLRSVDPKQLHALAYMSVSSHADAFGMALVFFGVECVVVGYLIRKSGYLPKVIGALMQIAGLCYLTNSFSLILYPPLADFLFPAILLPAFVGEASFCLWLLIRGVNVTEWERKASTTGELMQSGLLGKDWSEPPSSLQSSQVILTVKNGM